MSEITVIGGGLAGLVAAITCAEGGSEVRLCEAISSSAAARAAPTVPTRPTSAPTRSTPAACSGSGSPSAT